MSEFLEILLHIDNYLITFVATYGLWTYLVLFLVIFCETGLIVTPFLPGDSLLFAVGSFAAQPDSPLSLTLLFMLLTAAAFTGNQLNYFIGRGIGPRVFIKPSGRLLNKKHLQEAQKFYGKHGGKTIFMARFIPIVRSFVPFVAGACAMPAGRFLMLNGLSAVLWIGSLLVCGFFFGAIPLIKNNFSIAIYSIVFLSIFPSIWIFIYPRLKLYLSYTKETKE